MMRAKPHHSPKPIRMIVTGYIFLVGIVMALTGAFLTQVIMWMLFAPLFIIHPRWKSVLLGGALRFWCALGGFILNPFWQLKIVRQPPKGYRPSNTLMMINHLSSADPWIAAAALFPNWEMKFVYKADLLRLPVAGWALYFSGDLPIYFTKEKGGWGTRPGSVSAMMAEVKELHSKNLGLVVFPEGTRSRTGRLQPFKDGFFRYAVDSKCEVLPCAVHNAQALWPMGSSLFDIGTVYFAFGDPIRSFEGETVEELKERVQKMMLELLHLCPLFEPKTELPLTTMSSSRGLGITGQGTDSKEAGTGISAEAESDEKED